MNFNLITLKSPLEIVLTRFSDTGVMDETFKKREGYFSLAHMQSGDIIHQTAQRGAQELKAPCFGAVFYDEDIRVICKDAPHRYSSVMIRADFERRALDQEQLKEIIRHKDVTEEDFIILPHYIYDEKGDSAVKARIQKLICSRFNPNNESLSENLVYLIMAEMTRASIGVVYGLKYGGGIYGQKIYCRRAANYITEHIYEKLTVDDIAGYLNISKGYLVNFFKKCTGKPLWSI